jgi:hypothetical protein
VTGAITLTASSAIFLAGHVGGSMMVEAKDFSSVKAWEPQMDGVTVGMKVRSDGKVYQATAVTSQNRNGQIQPTHTKGEEWDGQGGKDVNNFGPFGTKWLYLHDRFGVGTITAIGGGGTTAT